MAPIAMCGKVNGGEAAPEGDKVNINGIVAGELLMVAAYFKNCFDSSRVR